MKGTLCSARPIQFAPFQRVGITWPKTREAQLDCGNVNLMPGFSVMMVYTCRECGEVVQLSDDPQIDRIFGPRQDDK
jgi:5-methylcytosine-specific restriction endonuclease McrA